MADKKDISAVPAGAEPMQVNIKDSINESVDAARSILERAELRSRMPIPEPEPIKERRRRTTVVETDLPMPAAPSLPVVRHVGGRITTPAGACPVKPQGYVKDWPDGPASDEVVRNWAHAVYNCGGGRFAPSAVVYWARNYWDINGPEFKRIKELVSTALARYDN